MAQFDLVLRRVRTRQAADQLVDIGIADGKIAAMSPEPLAGQQVVEGDGNLVTPSFVDGHLHLCKVYTLPMVGEAALRAYTGGSMGQAMTGIELAAAVKVRYEASWIYENARRALVDGLRHGVTHVQAFVDTDTKARLEGIEAILRLKREFQGVVDVRVVAFPQDGLLRDPGAEEYLRQALVKGADVVGGIPWIEDTDDEAREHVDRVFALAREFDRNVAMLVDDAGDPSLRSTELLAAAAVRMGWEDRITACHARAMQLYPEPYFRRLVNLAKRAGLTFVTDPHTGPLHLRVAELLAAGVPVALGQDDINDAYYPFGQHHLLEVAFLAAHILGFTTQERMADLLDMITTNGARVLRLPDHGVAVGCAANLVVLAGATVSDVLTRHLPPRFVISHGRLVAENREESTLYGLQA